MNRSRTLAAGYVAVIGALALFSAVGQRSEGYLAAVVLTLPLGMWALIGIYAGYALLKAVGGSFLSTTTVGGDDATWLTASSDTFNVILLMVVAVGNILLIRRLLSARRARMAVQRAQVSATTPP